MRQARVEMRDARRTSRRATDERNEGIAYKRTNEGMRDAVIQQFQKSLDAREKRDVMR